MISNTVRLRRLRILRDMVAVTPPWQFQMREWLTEGPTLAAHECGTVGCMLGLAAYQQLIPGLRASGWGGTPFYTAADDPDQACVAKYDSAGVGACAEMLAIPREEASFLCGMDRKDPLTANPQLITVDIQVKRIQKYIDYYEAHG